jgi:hypothetical protein
MVEVLWNVGMMEWWVPNREESYPIFCSSGPIIPGFHFSNTPLGKVDSTEGR